MEIRGGDRKRRNRISAGRKSKILRAFQQPPDCKGHRDNNDHQSDLKKQLAPLHAFCIPVAMLVMTPMVMTVALLIRSGIPAGRDWRLRLTRHAQVRRIVAQIRRTITTDGMDNYAAVVSPPNNVSTSPVM